MNEKKGNPKNEALELLRRYQSEVERLRGELKKKEKKGETNPFYEGMDKEIEKVHSFAKEHNLTDEEAFGALYGEEKFMALLEKEKMQKAKIPALSQNGNASDEREEGVLSRSEAWAAKKAGMTPADYLKYKK